MNQNIYCIAETSASRHGVEICGFILLVKFIVTINPLENYYI